MAITFFDRRGFLSVGLAATVAGCSRIPYRREARYIWQLGFGHIPEPEVSRAEIDKLPYATVRARIGKGPRGIMVLGQYDGPDLHWISADNVALVTRAGRIVKTAGLPENLKSSRIVEVDPVAEGLHNLADSAHKRVVDIDLGNSYGIEISSTYRVLGSERISILERDYDVLLVEERARALNYGWSFENRFWVDANSGFVWKSRQTVARSFGPVELEILKPAALPTSI